MIKVLHNDKMIGEVTPALTRSAALRCGSLKSDRFAPHRSAALQSRFRARVDHRSLS
jgi:hypothetical protein